MPAFVMPRLSDTMEEGTILAWLVEDSATVAKGQEIVEIEGDKAIVAAEATDDGELTILVAEGTTLAVREPIGWIGPDPPAGGPSNGGERVDTDTAQAPAAAAAAVPTGQASISPSARRMAAREGVDVEEITGSGPRGRVVVADVEAALATRREPSGGAEAAGPANGDRASAVETAKGEPDRVELSRTQELIARRMATAKATIPDFQVWTEVDMQKALEMREQVTEGATGARVTVNDLIVRAAALALREFPRVNASYRDGELDLFPRVNVAVAVAADDALYAPTVFDADRLSLAEVGAETRRLSALGRAGRLAPPQSAGATFTVSNLGMFGIVGFRAIVTPPQTAILAVGAVERRVVAGESAPEIRRRMDLTLSIDHRAVYGAEAARFLSRVRELLESPEGLA